MSEATDSMVSEGQAEEAPEVTESEFGFDASEDTLDEAPEAQSEQTEESEPQSTNANVPDEQEQGQLRHADYTRKTQDHAEQVRAFDERVKAWEQSQASQQAQIQQAIQALQTPQTSPNEGLVSQLQQVASNPNLSQEDRAGLNVIATMAQRMEQQEQTIAALTQNYEAMSPQVEQATQAVQGLTQRQTAELVTNLTQQKTDAVGAFGQEAVDAAMPLIGRMAVVNNQWTPPANPATGQPYTIPEMVGMVSGKIAQETQDAIGAQRNGSRGAKKVPGLTGNSTTSKPGAFADADGIAEIARNQAAFNVT